VQESKITRVERNLPDEPMERESFDNLLTFGNIMIVPEEELLCTQNFRVILELHCFLAFIQKPFELHMKRSLLIFDRAMQRRRVKNSEHNSRFRRLPWFPDSRKIFLIDFWIFPNVWEADTLTIENLLKA
jgi:hypothetical protein